MTEYKHLFFVVFLGATLALLVGTYVPSIMPARASKVNL